METVKPKVFQSVEIVKTQILKPVEVKP